MFIIRIRSIPLIYKKRVSDESHYIGKSLIISKAFTENPHDPEKYFAYAEQTHASEQPQVSS